MTLKSELVRNPVICVKCKSYSMEPNVKNPWHWNLGMWGKRLQDCYLLILSFSFKPLLPHFPAKCNSNKLIQIFFFYTSAEKWDLQLWILWHTNVFLWKAMLQNGMMDFMLNLMYDMDPYMIYCLKMISWLHVAWNVFWKWEKSLCKSTRCHQWNILRCWLVLPIKIFHYIFKNHVRGNCISFEMYYMIIKGKVWVKKNSISWRN